MTNTTEPQTATERAGKVIARCLYNTFARKRFDAPAFDQVSESVQDKFIDLHSDYVIAALHEAGLVIVDTTWHEAAGICMELYDFEQEKAP